MTNLLAIDCWLDNSIGARERKKIAYGEKKNVICNEHQKDHWQPAFLLGKNCNW